MLFAGFFLYWRLLTNIFSKLKIQIIFCFQITQCMNHINYDYVFQQNCDLDHKNAIFIHCYLSRFLSLQRL